MAEYKRGQKGRFTQKGEEERKVRSLRLTDSTWNTLGKWADEHNVTRADLIEKWVSNSQSEQIYQEGVRQEKMDDRFKSELKESLRVSIRNFFEKKKGDLKTSNILDLLFPEERRIRSLIGGLETSMGVIWEAVAVKLAKRNGFSILDENQILMPNPLPSKLQQSVDQLIQTRIGGTLIPTSQCVQQLKTVAEDIDRSQLDFVAPPSGHGIDIHLKKDGIEYLFDIKSPQPNQGDIERYTRQLLKWHAYKYAKDPSLQMEARIAFVYNPFKKDWYEHQQSKISNLLDKGKDIYVGDEFWNFCSGEENTWEKLKTLFSELRDEKFYEEFQDIFKKP